MGKALFATYPAARQLYSTSDAILGYRISDLCFTGPAESLQQTNRAQPALLVTEIAHLQALVARYASELSEPRFMAGHSLGEYAALVAAGSLKFDDALRLVAERGRLMQHAGSDIGEPSGMAALLGLDGADLAEVCEQAGV